MIPRSLKPWLVALMMVACVAYFIQDRAGKRRLASAGPVPEAPRQSDTRASVLQRAGYAIEPLADYTVRARVLSVERYRLGREADLSPVDFALGWGPMSDDAVLDKLTISQGNRWYYYRWSNDPPIDPSIIGKTSANTHLVPATDEMKNRLLEVRPGATVTLTGQLISVKHTDGWSWRSSLSREDTGANACELMWVTELRVE